ncbi:hypothetical protein PMAYCL1PPCAC_08839, partial [Pristionchus mayeri]
ESITTLKNGYVRWKFSPWRDYIEVKNETIAHIGAQIPEQVDSLILEIEKSEVNAKITKIKDREGLEKKIESLVFNIRGRELRKNECALEMNWDRYNQKRGSFLMAVDALVNKILQLDIMLSTCAHLRYDDCSSCINREFAGFSSRVASISSHVRKWLEKAQDLSFPRVCIEAVTQEIGTREIQSSEFNATAEIIHRLFEERGGYDKSYQVLIVPTEDDFHYFADKNSVNYSNFTIPGGSTVHIFQFGSKENSSRTDKSRIW